MPILPDLLLGVFGADSDLTFGTLLIFTPRFPRLLPVILLTQT
jgi:hypothetical protein